MGNNRRCDICGVTLEDWRRRTCHSADCRRRKLQQNVARHVMKKRGWRRRPGAKLVACRVCGQEYESISTMHLRKHNLSMAQYRTEHPDAPLVGEQKRESLLIGPKNRAYYLTYGGKEPDARLCSFLTGAMLGDGSLEKTGEHARYAEGGKNEEYAKFKHAILSSYFPCRLKDRLSKPHKRTGKRYRGWWVRTCVHPLLTRWWSAWYGERKVVARDMVREHLDAFGLAIWFFDDGHLGKLCRNAYLYTLAFGEDEAAWLSSLLAERFGISSHIRLNNVRQPYIYMGPAGRCTLLEAIRPFTAPGMEYKTCTGP